MSASQFVPGAEPGFVPGRPNIYVIYYPKVNGLYVGKSETGRANYMGSPSAAVLKAIRDAHSAIGIGPEDIVREKHIVWSPPDATIAACRDQEWIWIGKARLNHDGPVFNKFPIEDWMNHFDWFHDPVTHVDRATSGRWPVIYLKLGESCDVNGNCSLCGQPWGDEMSGMYWCKKVYVANGREELLYQGTCVTLPYKRFLEDKLRMINGEAA